jgi:hypothetical protein
MLLKWWVAALHCPTEKRLASGIRSMTLRSSWVEYWVESEICYINCGGEEGHFPRPLLLRIYLQYLYIFKPPGGSSTVHIYTKTVHRRTQFLWEECGPWRVLCGPCPILGAVPHYKIFSAVLAFLSFLLHLFLFLFIFTYFLPHFPFPYFLCAPYSYFFASIPSFIHNLISNSLIQERFYLRWGPNKSACPFCPPLGMSQAQEVVSDSNCR